MAVSLKKNSIYRLQFAISNVSAGQKASITIKNNARTETYIDNAAYGNATHTVYFSPKEAKDKFDKGEWGDDSEAEQMGMENVKTDKIEEV